MKEIYLNLHSKSCLAKKDINPNFLGFNGNDFCEHNPERFLFFLGNEFWIIVYHRCLVGYDDNYDFKVELIKKIIDKHKIFKRYDVNKSINVERDLGNFRIKNQTLRKWIQQVNYIYEDMTHKQYAITTTTNYLDAICDMYILKQSFDDAKEYLLKHGYDFMLESLNELFDVNRLDSCNEDVAYHVSTINQLLKQIHKCTK